MITFATYLKKLKNSPVFFKILKEPNLLQKQTIPHIKALLFSFLEPEEQGHGIIMEVPRPHPVTFLYLFFLRSWRPSEVDETKTECFISNLPISGSQKSLGFDYNVIESWKNVCLKCINLSPRTLYITCMHKFISEYLQCTYNDFKIVGNINSHVLDH